MKIRIRSNERAFTVMLPTRLLFCKSILKLGLKIGKRYSDAVPDIPPKALEALCDEIRRIKKKHPSWELVNIRSADGSAVQILL